MTATGGVMQRGSAFAVANVDVRLLREKERDSVGGVVARRQVQRAHVVR